MKVLDTADLMLAPDADVVVPPPARDTAASVMEMVQDEDRSALADRIRRALHIDYEQHDA